MIGSKQISRLRVWVGSFFLIVVSLMPFCVFGGYGNFSAKSLSTILMVADDVSHVTILGVRVAERASPSMVGAVMALLATFQDADVLPPEGTARANQLIHGLIQLQSVLVKSQSPEFSEYVSAAVRNRFGEAGGDILKSVYVEGLSSQVLEALFTYNRISPIWDRTALVQIFQSYNISQLDWELMDKTITNALAVYQARESSIHGAYARWRRQMSMKK